MYEWTTSRFERWRCPGHKPSVKNDRPERNEPVRNPPRGGVEADARISDRPPGGPLSNSRETETRMADLAYLTITIVGFGACALVVKLVHS